MVVEIFLQTENLNEKKIHKTSKITQNGLTEKTLKTPKTRIRKCKMKAEVTSGAI